jgi:hypothetical protein
MKNLASHIEKLDELPKRKAARPFDTRDTRYANRIWNFPYKRVHRWLESQKGELWDDIVSRYVKLPWITPMLRTHKKIAEQVYENTYMENGKVMVYERWAMWDGPKSVEDLRAEVLYVHPETRRLCHKPRVPYADWRAKERRELKTWIRFEGPYHQLIKIFGVWFEVTLKNITPEIESKLDIYKPLINKDGLNYPMYDYCSPYFAKNPTIVKRQLNHTELKRYGLTNTPEIKHYKKAKGTLGGNAIGYRSRGQFSVLI